MKRSGDELNLSEGERGSKNRKTLNFALAYRDGIEGNASSGSSIGNYGFKISIVLCDGASSNLTLLKLLCGSPRASLPVNEDADELRARYFAKMSFVNPEDPSGNPIFAMICPSHQVLSFSK